MRIQKSRPDFAGFTKSKYHLYKIQSRWLGEFVG
jgi:hypothetical protein